MWEPDKIKTLPGNVAPDVSVVSPDIETVTKPETVIPFNEASTVNPVTLTAPVPVIVLPEATAAVIFNGPLVTNITGIPILAVPPKAKVVLSLGKLLKFCPAIIASLTITCPGPVIVLPFKTAATPSIVVPETTVVIAYEITVEASSVNWWGPDNVKALPGKVAPDVSVVAPDISTVTAPETVIPFNEAS